VKWSVSVARAASTTPRQGVASPTSVPPTPLKTHCTSTRLAVSARFERFATTSSAPLASVRSWYAVNSTDARTKGSSNSVRTSVSASDEGAPTSLGAAGTGAERAPAWEASPGVPDAACTEGAGAAHPAADRAQASARPERSRFIGSVRSERAPCPGRPGRCGASVPGSAPGIQVLGHRETPA